MQKDQDRQLYFCFFRVANKKVIFILLKLPYLCLPFSPDPEFYEINYPSVTFHAVNIGWTLVDFCFTAVPVRILHAYQSLCFAIIYGIFTLIYWQAGGTDERGNPYIYSVIDHGNDPKTAVAWIAFLFLALIFLHVLWFGLYRLRLLIYRSCGCGQVSPMEPTPRGVNHPI